MRQDKYKKVVIFALCGFMMFPLCAQKTYTLEQCRSMALAHNIKMKKAHTDLKAAEQTKKEAFTGYFPTVGATGADLMQIKVCLKWNWLQGWECLC